jgi:hypothetical protein
MLLAVIVAVAQIFVLLLAEEGFVAIFTTEESVKKQMHLAWGIFMVFVFFDTT